MLRDLQLTHSSCVKGNHLNKFERCYGCHRMNAEIASS